MQQHHRRLAVLDLEVLVDQALALVDRSRGGVVQILDVKIQGPDFVAVRTESRTDLYEVAIGLVLENCRTRFGRLSLAVCLNRPLIAIEFSLRIGDRRTTTYTSTGSLRFRREVAMMSVSSSAASVELWTGCCRIAGKRSGTAIKLSCGNFESTTAF